MNGEKAIEITLGRLISVQTTDEVQSGPVKRLRGKFADLLSQITEDAPSESELDPAESPDHSPKSARISKSDSGSDKDESESSEPAP
jgi:hypothetical protein